MSRGLPSPGRAKTERSSSSGGIFGHTSVSRSDDSSLGMAATLGGSLGLQFGSNSERASDQDSPTSPRPVLAKESPEKSSPTINGDGNANTSANSLSQGGDSIILEEEIDPNYAPTEEEVLEYARWLRMDLEKDQDLFWIAKEGLKAPLPKEWKPCKTRDTEEIYYFNFSTGQSTWDHPCDEYYRNLYEEHKRKKVDEEKAANDVAKQRAQMDVAMLTGKHEEKIVQKKTKKKKKRKSTVVEDLPPPGLRRETPLPGVDQGLRATIPSTSFRHQDPLLSATRSKRSKELAASKDIPDRSAKAEEKSSSRVRDDMHQKSEGRMVSKMSVRAEAKPPKKNVFWGADSHNGNARSFNAKESVGERPQTSFASTAEAASARDLRSNDGRVTEWKRGSGNNAHDAEEQRQLAHQKFAEDMDEEQRRFTQELKRQREYYEDSLGKQRAQLESLEQDLTRRIRQKLEQGEEELRSLEAEQHRKREDCLREAEAELKRELERRSLEETSRAPEERSGKLSGTSQDETDLFQTRQALNELHAELAAAESSAQGLAQEKADAEARVKVQSETLETLRKDHASKSEALSRLRTVANTLKNDLDSAKKRVASLEASNGLAAREESSEQISLRTEVEQLRGNLTIAAGERDKFQNEFQELQREMEGKVFSYNALKAKYDAKCEDASTLQRERDELRSKMGNGNEDTRSLLQTMLRQKDSELSRIRNECSQKNLEVLRLQSELSTLRSELSRVKTDLDTERHSVAVANEAWVAARNGRQSMAEQLREARRLSQDETTRHREVSKSLQDSVQKLNADVKAMSLERTQLQEQLRESRRSLRDAEQRMKAAEEQDQRLPVEGPEVQALQLKVEEYNKKLLEATERAESFKKRVRDSATALMQRDSELESLRQELSVLQDKLDAHESDLARQATKEDSYNPKLERLQQLSKQVTDQERQLRQRGRDIDKLTIELEVANEERQEQETRLKNLELDLQNAQEEAREAQTALFKAERARAKLSKSVEESLGEKEKAMGALRHQMDEDKRTAEEERSVLEAENAMLKESLQTEETRPAASDRKGERDGEIATLRSTVDKLESDVALLEEKAANYAKQILDKEIIIQKLSDGEKMASPQPPKEEHASKSHSQDYSQGTLRGADNTQCSFFEEDSSSREDVPEADEAVGETLTAPTVFPKLSSMRFDSNLETQADGQRRGSSEAPGRRESVDGKDRASAQLRGSYDLGDLGRVLEDILTRYLDDVHVRKTNPKAAAAEEPEDSPASASSSLPSPLEPQDFFSRRAMAKKWEERIQREEKMQEQLRKLYEKQRTRLKKQRKKLLILQEKWQRERKEAIVSPKDPRAMASKWVLRQRKLELDGDANALNEALQHIRKVNEYLRTREETLKEYKELVGNNGGDLTGLEQELERLGRELETDARSTASILSLSCIETDDQQSHRICDTNHFGAAGPGRSWAFTSENANPNKVPSPIFYPVPLFPGSSMQPGYGYGIPLGFASPIQGTEVMSASQRKGPVRPSSAKESYLPLPLRRRQGGSPEIGRQHVMRILQQRNDTRAQIRQKLSTLNNIRKEMNTLSSFPGGERDGRPGENGGRDKRHNKSGQVPVPSPFHT